MLRDKINCNTCEQLGTTCNGGSQGDCYCHEYVDKQTGLSYYEIIYRRVRWLVALSAVGLGMYLGISALTLILMFS